MDRQSTQVKGLDAHIAWMCVFMCNDSRYALVLSVIQLNQYFCLTTWVARCISMDYLFLNGLLPHTESLHFVVCLLVDFHLNLIVCMSQGFCFLEDLMSLIYFHTSLVWNSNLIKQVLKYYICWHLFVLGDDKVVIFYSVAAVCRHPHVSHIVRLCGYFVHTKHVWIVKLNKIILVFMAQWAANIYIYIL